MHDTKTKHRDSKGSLVVCSQWVQLASVCSFAEAELQSKLNYIYRPVHDE